MRASPARPVTCGWWRSAGMICALLLLCLAAPPAGAVVALVSGPDYGPYADPLMPGGGFVTEIIRRAFQLEDIGVSIEFLPWQRGYDALKSGGFAGAFPYVETPERQVEMLFSDPLYAVPNQLVFRRSQERRFAGPDSLRHLVMCQPLGYALPTTLAASIRAGDIGLAQPRQMQLCAQMLAAGRVDFLIASPCTHRYVIAPAAGVDTALGGDVVQVNPLHLVLPRGDPKAPELMRIFNQGLGRLRASGEWTRIVENRLGRSGLDCPPPPLRPAGPVLN